jgi:hypothetical protein
VFISFASFAQDTNKVIIDENSSEPMLIGYCTREAFKDTNFSAWFNSGYKDYKVDSSVLAELNSRLNDVSITIITGTWCSDSRVELPAFFKIIDYLRYPEEKLTMIAVNEEKEIPGSSILDKYNLELVPSFIFYRNGSELGRIQEMPEESLEKDMVRIVTGQE